jgi:hypothetical protein
MYALNIFTVHMYVPDYIQNRQPLQCSGFDFCKIAQNQIYKKLFFERTLSRKKVIGKISSYFTGICWGGAGGVIQVQLGRKVIFAFRSIKQC